jgi:hypothetical protein
VRRFFWILLIYPLLLPAPAALAGSGGSIYSFMGIGDLRLAPNVRAAGMGYTGYAIAGPFYINTLSPATWSRIDRARIEAGLLFEGFNSTNGTASRFLAKADFSGAMIAIPVSTAKGIVVAAGFTPYSKVDYNTYTAATFIGTADTMAYSINHTGRGGISKGTLGVSYAPSRMIAVGAGLNYLFGTLEKASTIIPRSSSYAGGSQNEETTMNGTSFTLSALVDSLGSVSPFLAPFSFGISLTSRANLTSTHRYTYLFTGLRDTTQETESNLVVPATLGFGITYRPSERVLIAADITTQAWASSEYRGKSLEGIRNSTLFGIGMERVPAREAGQPLLDRIAYRFGAMYHATYFAPNGDPVNAWAVTAGVGIPVSADTRLNLAIEYGSRGSTEKSMIKDTILRFSASITISELWFSRFEED